MGKVADDVLELTEDQIIEEVFDPDLYFMERDDNLRGQALAAANFYAVQRGDGAADAVIRAQAYYDFLTGRNLGSLQ